VIPNSLYYAMSVEWDKFTTPGFIIVTSVSAGSLYSAEDAQIMFYSGILCDIHGVLLSQISMIFGWYGTYVRYVNLFELERSSSARATRDFSVVEGGG
jgi:hypothetical protein